MRRGRGVISATIATVMVLYMQIATSVRMMAEIRRARLPTLFAIAMSGVPITARNEPAMMKGVRRPSFEVQRSERMPKSGRRNSPKMLSIAITNPVTAFERPKVCVSIFGMMPSKTCQKLIIPMNGRLANATVA